MADHRAEGEITWRRRNDSKTNDFHSAWRRASRRFLLLLVHRDATSQPLVPIILTKATRSRALQNIKCLMTAAFARASATVVSMSRSPKGLLTLTTTTSAASQAASRPWSFATPRRLPLTPVVLQLPIPLVHTLLTITALAATAMAPLRQWLRRRPPIHLLVLSPISQTQA